MFCQTVYHPPQDHLACGLSVCLTSSRSAVQVLVFRNLDYELTAGQVGTGSEKSDEVALSPLDRAAHASMTTMQSLTAVLSSRSTHYMVLSENEIEFIQLLSVFNLHSVKRNRCKFKSSTSSPIASDRDQYLVKQVQYRYNGAFMNISTHTFCGAMQ